MTKLGGGLRSVLKAHFRNRNMSSNSESKRAQKGWKQAGIWKKIMDRTDLAGATETTATVSISEPAFRAKLFGLRNLRPVRGKMLAIPLDARAYGRPPKNNPIPGMFCLTVKRTGKTYLAIRDGKAGLKVMYRLIESVSVPEDPHAMPPEQLVYDEFMKIITGYLNR